MSSGVVAFSGLSGQACLGAAVVSFLLDAKLSSNTERAYFLALSAVAQDVGCELPVDRLDARRLLDVSQRNWGGHLSPPLWNTRLTAVQSLGSRGCR